MPVHATSPLVTLALWSCQTGLLKISQLALGQLQHLLTPLDMVCLCKALKLRSLAVRALNQNNSCCYILLRRRWIRSRLGSGSSRSQRQHRFLPSLYLLPSFIKKLLGLNMLIEDLCPTLFCVG